MAMNISSAQAYANYSNSYNTNSTKSKSAAKNTEKTTADKTVSKTEERLSKPAQKLLESLRASHTDMDFIAADFKHGDNAKELLAQSDKEFTVIFSKEELEKMAANEKYYDQKMKELDGAVRMSEEINKQFGFERAFGKGEGLPEDVAITKFGISFNKDGSTTFFAQLEQFSSNQKERIEAAREKKAEQKKEAQQKDGSSVNSIKKVVVKASTKEELIDKIGAIDWDKVKAENTPVGTSVDYTI